MANFLALPGLTQPLHLRPAGFVWLKNPTPTFHLLCINLQTEAWEIGPPAGDLRWTHPEMDIQLHAATGILDRWHNGITIPVMHEHGEGFCLTKRLPPGGYIPLHWFNVLDPADHPPIPEIMKALA